MMMKSHYGTSQFDAYVIKSMTVCMFDDKRKHLFVYVIFYIFRDLLCVDKLSSTRLIKLSGVKHIVVVCMICFVIKF